MGKEIVSQTQCAWGEQIDHPLETPLKNLCQLVPAAAISSLPMFYSRIDISCPQQFSCP